MISATTFEKLDVSRPQVRADFDKPHGPTNKTIVFWFLGSIVSWLIVGCAGQVSESPDAEPVAARAEDTVSTGPSAEGPSAYQRLLRRLNEPSPIPELVNIDDQLTLRDIALERGADSRADGSYIEHDKGDFKIAYGALQKITNEQYLVDIALEKTSSMVLRINAAKRVTIKELLLELALQSHDIGPAFPALTRLEASDLLDVATSAQSFEVAIKAVTLLKNPADINYVAKNALTLPVRVAAIRRVTDNDVLRDLVLNGGHRKERLTAVAATTDMSLLARLVQDDNDAGVLAQLRLASLQITPYPDLRISILPSGMTYRRPGRNSGYEGPIVNVQGEMIQVILYEPQGAAEGNRAVKYSVTFESEYPGVYKSAFVPAKLKKAPLIKMLRKYLQAEVDPRDIERFASSSTDSMLREAARSLTL